MPTKGWLTPNNPTPTDYICRRLLIPDDLAFLTAVNGALLDLTYAYNWAQFGTMSPEDAAAAMFTMFTGYTFDPCGGDCTLPNGGRVFRVGQGGRLEELSSDGTSWQTPTGDAELPDVPARTNPTAEQRICIASANAANVLEQVYEDMLDSYNFNVDPIFGVTSWVGTTGAVIALGLGVITAGVATVLFGVFSVFYEIFDELTADLWDTAFTDNLVCLLISVSTDTAGVVTFDYNRLLEALAGDVDFADNPFQLLLFGQIYYMMQFIGADGLNLAGATTAITSYTCSCPFDYFIDFRGSNAGWTIVNGSLQSTGIVLVQQEFSTPSARWKRTVTMPTGTKITRIEVWFHRVFGAESSLYSLPMNPSTPINITPNSGDGFYSAFVYNNLNLTGTLALEFAIIKQANQNTGDYVSFVRVVGQGANPFD